MDNYFWPLVASLVLAAFVICALFVFLLRWKISFSGNEYTLLPSDTLDENSRELNGLKKSINVLSDNQASIATKVLEHHIEISNRLLTSNSQLDQKVQSLLSAFRDLREEYRILNKEIEAKSAELERHREGYDTRLARKALIPIARMHRAISSELTAANISAELTSALEPLQEECLDVLEREGVELSWPKIGDRYRDYNNIKHPPQTVLAEDPNSVGKIASVAHPAYSLSNLERAVVLLPAVVEIFSAPASPSPDTPAQLDEENPGG